MYVLLEILLCYLRFFRGIFTFQLLKRSVPKSRGGDPREQKNGRANIT